MNKWKIKFFKNHIEYGYGEWFETHPYYFYFWDWVGFKKIKGTKFFDCYATYYDGHHRVLRLGPVRFSWQSPWTKLDKDDPFYN